MITTELKTPIASVKSRAISCRLAPQDFAPVRKVADELFDGNFSRMLRTALDSYIIGLKDSGKLTFLD